MTITLYEKGIYQVRITRTSGLGEHVEGIISLSGSAGFCEKFRSDRGGIIVDFTLIDDGEHELKVTASAHSWISGLFGCKDSKIEIIVQNMEGVDEAGDDDIPEYVRIMPGDMLDHRTGNGYSHGMLYLGTKQEARSFSERFRPEAKEDIIEEGHYVIDYGPAGKDPGADTDGDTWPDGVKVHKVDILDDGTWKWKIYRSIIAGGPPLGAELAIQRAFSLYHNLDGASYMGIKGYSLSGNNCHHFVSWCKYGTAAHAHAVGCTLTAGRVRRSLQFPL